MPQHQVSFSFAIEGAVTDILAYANGMKIKTWQADGKFVGGFRDALINEGSKVTVHFVIIGLNGTGYKITAQFQDNGVTEPGSQPSPIEGSIETNMKATETITYQA